MTNAALMASKKTGPDQRKDRMEGATPGDSMQAFIEL